jgi:acetolactate synthase-1/2/3 large subunit
MRGAATARRPGQILTMGPHGTLGCGPGFSLGAWAANRKPVLYYTGDGSFGLYAMEFDTFDRHGVPVVCVISNDSAWGMIKQGMALYRPQEVQGGHVGVDLAPMRAYERMAAMWDGYGQLIRQPEEIVPALRRAAVGGKPAILNVEVDQESPSPVTRGMVPYE